MINSDSFNPVVKIKVNGQAFINFDGLSITHSMNRLFASCSFRLASVLNDETYRVDNLLVRGDKIEIFVYENDVSQKGTVAFKGRVHRVGMDLKGSAVITAATNMMKLSKCNYRTEEESDKRHFIKTWATNIIKLMAGSYGVPIVAEYKKHDLKIVKDYNVSYDETVTQPTPRSYASNVRLTLFTVKATDTIEQAIRRICDKIGVIPLDDRKGGIMLVDKYHLQTDTVLEYGKNLIGGTYDTNDSGIHSNYHVLSRSAVEVGKKSSAERTYIETDVKCVDVEEYKNKTILVDALDEDECSLAGAAEAKRDIINGMQIQVSVPTWWTEESMLWFPNMAVPIKVQPWSLEGQVLIVGVNLMYSTSQGFRTVLDIKPDTVLAYDDPATYKKRPIEDDDVAGYLEKKKNKKKKKHKKGRRVNLTDADIDAMTLADLLEAGGTKYVDGN